MPHVFDRFRRVDTSTERSTDGLGLGLGIVSHLTALHGGTVSADSPGVGKGATFTVMLPIFKSISAVKPEISSDTALQLPHFGSR